MKCSIICMNKKKYGLDIRNLAILNKVLLGKWSWRSTSKREPLWKWVIEGKYREAEGKVMFQ